MSTTCLSPALIPATARAAHVSLTAAMRGAHQDKLELCAALESIADALPDRCDALTCLCVASSLVPLLRTVHRYEEEVVFPAYAVALGANVAARSIERLKAEHIEDECFADELTEALMAIGHGGKVANPEATGFMLRGFFETIRRHIAFEREHILPVVEKGGG